MTEVLISETESRLAMAIAPLLVARGLEPIAAPTGALPGTAAALIVTDMAPTLMAQPVAPLADPLPAPRLKHLSALIERALTAGLRVVLLAAAPPAPGQAPRGVHRQSTQLEAALARKAELGVILRASDIMDPADPALRTAVQALIDGSQAVWPDTDPVQIIALSDLARAVASAAQTKGVAGSWYDIVHPQAVQREVLQAEAQRLHRVLTDPMITEIQVRPDYPPAEGRRDGAPGALALHVAPARSVHVLLAETVQGLIQDSVAAGRMAPLRPPMPAVHRALETGALPLEGAHIVVTGATGGIGRAAVRMLVRLGAHVTGIARNAAKGQLLADELSRDLPALTRQRARLDRERAAREGTAPRPGALGSFRFLPADLTDLPGLTALAPQISAPFGRIDGLIHLAGAAFRTRAETDQGIERTLAITLIAPVTLTRLLADPLRAAGTPWVLTVVGENQAEHPFDPTDLQSRNVFIPKEVLAHAQSAMVAMTGALAEVMRGTGVRCAAVALAPVRTDFLLGLEEPLSGGATARQVQQTQREQARMQQDTPDHAAGQVLDVLVSADYQSAHGSLIQGEAIQGSALGAQGDRDRVAALWKVCAELAGLPE